MAKKIRTGDSVIVTAGNCKGISGVVQSVDGDKVIVDGVNKRMRHLRKNGQNPGRVEAFFAPIHVSNLAHCLDGKPIKVGFKMLDGKKCLINKKTSERIRSVW